MLFCNLLDLPYDRNTDIIDLDALRGALPTTPEAVLTQFYADHGRKDDFQSQYDRLRLDSLAWDARPMAASDVVRASVNSDFLPWVDNVARRFDRFAHRGWSCIDSREDVVSHWRQHGTWLVPPVGIISIPWLKGLRIVEGHSRLGILRGALEHGLLRTASLHQLWVGSP